MGWIQLSSQYESLAILGHWGIIAAAGAVFLIEFLADKIPAVDTCWDAIHTFIRPIGAAFLGAAAIGKVDNVPAIVCVLLCGGVALTSHASKSAFRVLVNHSPEPFSNVATSLAEDGIALGGLWLWFTHPYVLLGLVICFLAAAIWLLPKAFRLLKKSFRKLKSFFSPDSNKPARAAVEL